MVLNFNDGRVLRTIQKWPSAGVAIYNAHSFVGGVRGAGVPSDMSDQHFFVFNSSEFLQNHDYYTKITILRYYVWAAHLEAPHNNRQIFYVNRKEEEKK